MYASINQEQPRVAVDGLRQRSTHSLDDHLLQQGEQDRVFRREIEVERGAADARPFGEVVDGNIGQGPLFDETLRGCQDGSFYADRARERASWGCLVSKSETPHWISGRELATTIPVRSAKMWRQATWYDYYPDRCRNNASSGAFQQPGSAFLYGR
jgi:hypothetical protein